MRFVHTADWQIGMKAAHVGKVAQKVREERLEAAARVVETANAHNVDFMLLAGDTFEDDAVDRVLVQRVADILAGFQGPIFMIPGNHDPLVPGSVWEHASWGDSENIRVLTEEKPVEITGGVLFPCPVLDKHSRKDQTAWIDAYGSEGIRIGLAHGTVEGVPHDEPDLPIRTDAAAGAGLDYLALGHFHSTSRYPDSSGAVRMAYSGTHEVTKFGERDSGNILLVEIQEAGAVPEITPLKTGRLKWQIIEEKLRQTGELARIRKQIEDMKDTRMTLIDIRLSGLLPFVDHEELVRLREVLDSRFLFWRFDASFLRPPPKDESWIASLPAGVIQEAAIVLKELSDPGSSGHRPEGVSPEIAWQALMELYSIVEEAES